MSKPTYIAKEFEAASPDVLVIGQTMQSFLENVQSNIIKPILEKHDIQEIEPEEWYPHQLWMDILKDIQDTLPGGNRTTAFVAFGRAVVEKAIMPPEMKTIPDVLNALHAIHHLNLKNAPEEEGFHIEEIGEQHLLVYENTPNPTYAIYGYLWGICARFKGEGESFTVEIVNNPKPDLQPGICYDVVWGK